MGGEHTDPIASDPSDEWAASVRLDGYGLARGAVVSTAVSALLDAVAALPASRSGRGGQRAVLRASAAIRAAAGAPPLWSLAARVLGESARPVKATLFDKTHTANWGVPWHQDVVIAVRERRDVEGYGPWSTKAGIPHVRPPVAILERILALRVHLDPAPADHGALRVIPGSHRWGVLDADAAAQRRARGSEVCCPAARGDVLAMFPLILHASSACSEPDHRRVLHLEYAAVDLPGGLAWDDA